MRMRGWFGVLFLRPCEDACGRGLSIGIRGKYDMGNEVKWLFTRLVRIRTFYVPCTEIGDVNNVPLTSPWK